MKSLTPALEFRDSERHFNCANFEIDAYNYGHAVRPSSRPLGFGTSVERRAEMEIPEGTIFCTLCEVWRSASERNEHKDCFEADEQSENYDRNAPWRDWPPYPQGNMDRMYTRGDGPMEFIEWMHASNDGNLDAGWVIYRPGDEAPALITSGDKEIYG